MNSHKAVLLRLACCLGMAVSTHDVFAGTPPQYAFSIKLPQVPQPFSPFTLAIDPGGNVYVGCSGQVIAKMSGNGSFITQWSASPDALAFDSAINYVFSADSEANTVNEFFPDGTFYQEWGGMGSLPGQFFSPGGIAIAADGTIFVSDTFNQRIQVFDGSAPGASYVTSWGVLGDGPGQIDGPGPMAVDSNTNVYVLDLPTNSIYGFRVQRFLADGTFQNQWFTPPETTAYAGIAGIATDPSNRVYVVDAANNDVLVYNTNGTLLTQWGSTGSGPGQFQFSTPAGIAVDPTGNYVYVVDNYNSRIQVFAYAPGAPIVYGQPASQTVPAGVNVTLTASVYGATTISYQWFTNGIAVAGATNSALAIPNIDPAASGISYSVLVTNPLGGVFSSNAVVTVVPALATTLPANAITATGANLNGSATIGSYPTVAWFEWGTDTTYGSFTAQAGLPLNSTLNVSNTLGGLTGAIVYHYRIDTSNSLGIVYGADQIFSVGLKPAVATLPVSNITASSVTVNASANPEGLETIVYFNWGTTTGYGHRTPFTDIGIGASQVVVTNTIGGLVPATVYHYQVVASNSLGTVTGNDATFIAGPWNYSLATANPITVIAASADGANVIAGSSQYVWSGSHDGGATWKTTNQPEAAWLAIGSSADGQRLALACGTGGNCIFLSSNAGASWNRVPGPIRNWTGLASSGDGSRLAATADFPALVSLSTNGGSTWATNNPPAAFQWSAIASSADGLKLVVAAGASQPASGVGPVYSSTNGGLTWNTNNIPRNYWQSIASSADGTKLAVAAGGYYTNGPIYLSSNSGVTWIPSTAPVTNWQAIASSADGTRLAAIPRTGSLIYFSADSGNTWTTSLLPSGTWYSLAVSADGGKIFVGGSQGIFSLQNVVAPSLNSSVAGSNVVVSWTVPSVPFQLQQTPNLFRGNWAPVTNPPVLSPNTTRDQVVLPPSTPAGFYRLVQP